VSYNVNEILLLLCNVEFYQKHNRFMKNGETYTSDKYNFTTNDKWLYQQRCSIKEHKLNIDRIKHLNQYFSQWHNNDSIILSMINNQ